MSVTPQAPDADDAAAHAGTHYIPAQQGTGAGNIPPWTPQGGTPQQKPPKQRRRWPWVVAIAALLLILIVTNANHGSSTSTTTTAAPVAAPQYTVPDYSAPSYTAPTYSAPSYTAPTTEAAPAVDPNTFTAGTYEVGTDIKPGTYKTTGSSWCYWERDKDASGEFSSIIANGNSNGPGIMTIKSSDGYVKFTGTCTWTKK